MVSTMRLSEWASVSRSRRESSWIPRRGKDSWSQISAQSAEVAEFLVATRLHLRARLTGWLMFRLEQHTIFLNQ